MRSLADAIITPPDADRSMSTYGSAPSMPSRRSQPSRRSAPRMTAAAMVTVANTEKPSTPTAWPSVENGPSSGSWTRSQSGTANAIAPAATTLVNSA